MPRPQCAMTHHVRKGSMRARALPVWCGVPMPFPPDPAICRSGSPMQYHRLRFPPQADWRFLDARARASIFRYSSYGDPPSKFPGYQSTPRSLAISASSTRPDIMEMREHGRYGSGVFHRSNSIGVMVAYRPFLRRTLTLESCDGLQYRFVPPTIPSIAKALAIWLSHGSCDDN
jgi:hypothetical protein